MILGKYQEALNLFAHHPIRKHYAAAYMAGCHARLGDMRRARTCVAECLALRPDFSVRHWMSKEPFKVEADAERAQMADNAVRYEAALRVLTGQIKTMLSAIQG